MVDVALSELDNNSFEKDRFRGEKLKNMVSKSSTRKRNAFSVNFVASKLASGLASFFDVDESQIKSNLLSNRISIDDLSLIPRILRQNSQCAIELRGTIDFVELTWNWDIVGKKRMGYMADVVLILRGVKVQLVPVTGNNSEVPSTSMKAELPRKKSQSNMPNWISTIIDHSTILMEDLVVTIEIPDGVSIEQENPYKESFVVFTVKKFDMKSLGRIETGRLSRSKIKKKKSLTKAAPLLQKFHAGCFAAYVLLIDKNWNKQRLPLIDPFEYSFKVKRFHGKRFIGGLQMGLEVLGEQIKEKTASKVISIAYPIEKSTESRDVVEEKVKSLNERDGDLDKVEIYAGNEEVEASLPIKSLGGGIKENAVKLQTSEVHRHSWQKEKIEVNDTVSIHLGKDQVEILFRMLRMLNNTETRQEVPVKEISHRRDSFMRPGRLSTIKNSLQFSKSSREVNLFSRYELPVKTVSIKLPNGAVTCFKNCKFRYKADGTRCQLVGTGGIYLDQISLLRDKCNWVLNLVDKEICVHANEKVETNFWNNEEKHETAPHLQSNLAQVRKIQEGFSAFIACKNRILEPLPAPSSSQPWSLKFNGMAHFNF